MPTKVRGPRWRPVMKLAEVLAVLKAGTYRVDTDAGKVFGPRGEEVKPDPRGRCRCGTGRGEYLFVRLYVTLKGERKVKTIARSRLVWMAATESEVPAGFEIHHDDEDPKNDAFGNLLCLHKLDHRKKHRRAWDPDNEVPF